MIQKSIDVAVEWTVNNDMEMNPEKSRDDYMFLNVNFRNNVPNVVVEGNLVEQVDHAKLLGITLSNDLTWNKHVDNIVKKAAKRVYMIYHLKRSGISQTDLVKCICALLDLSWNMLVRYGILIYQYTYPMTLKWFRREF